MVILVLLAAFFLGQRIYPSERDTVTEESITFTGTFYRVLADGTEQEIQVPGRCDVPAGELLVIRSVLPQDYKENTIAIRSSLENVRIYIGGELRTVYDTENTRPFGKNSASRYVFCETSGEDAGKEVRIELQSFTHKYSGVVNTVYCGDKLDIWAYMFHCYFMVTLIACTMLFAGLVVLIISLVLDIVYKTRFDLEYLGWCMILGAVWMLGESKLRQLFDSFRAAKNAAAETSAASLSCGLCMCRQGDNFEEYYIKADKALYYANRTARTITGFMRSWRNSSRMTLRYSGDDPGRTESRLEGL